MMEEMHRDQEAEITLFPFLFCPASTTDAIAKD